MSMLPISSKLVRSCKLLKALSGLENVSGSVLGGLIGGGKPDVKNVMNVVSVSHNT